MAVSGRSRRLEVPGPNTEGRRLRIFQDTDLPWAVAVQTAGRRCVVPEELLCVLLMPFVSCGIGDHSEFGRRLAGTARGYDPWPRIEHRPSGCGRLAEDGIALSGGWLPGRVEERLPSVRVVFRAAVGTNDQSAGERAMTALLWMAEVHREWMVEQAAAAGHALEDSLPPSPVGGPYRDHKGAVRPSTQPLDTDVVEEISADYDPGAAQVTQAGRCCRPRRR